MIWKMFTQFSEPKNMKISTSKLSLKVQNINFKPILIPESTLNKPCFETDYLGQNAKKILKLKLAQFTIIFGLLHRFKKVQISFKSSPISKKWPNLVTLFDFSSFSFIKCFKKRRKKFPFSEIMTQNDLGRFLRPKLQQATKSDIEIASVNGA
jgi:hypothetical protein